MSIAADLKAIKSQLPEGVTLVAVSKTHPIEKIQEAYEAGQRDFGENRVQELLPKYEALPKDIRWHLIGHLQTNKVKSIISFVHLIHSVDSEKLVREINNEAGKCGRVVHILLQIFIAQEETKFGFSFEEAEKLLHDRPEIKYPHVRITGIMGMATNTKDLVTVEKEFHSLHSFFSQLKTRNPQLATLSTGMSSDWRIAVQEGSTMIRVGSSIFGQR